MVIPAPRISTVGGHRQSGAILIVTLLFLVILTLIGLSAMSTTTFEEKMSGASRDWNLALAAAEAAIRDAEYDISAKYVPGQPTAVRQIGGLTGFGDETSAENGTCSTSSGSLGLGLCRRTASGGTPTMAPASSPVVSFLSTDTKSVAYGTYTGASVAGYPIKGVSQQPRYFITGYAVQTAYDTGLTYFYEITARGFGANPNTQVTLREVFRRPQ